MSNNFGPEKIGRELKKQNKTDLIDRKESFEMFDALPKPVREYIANFPYNVTPRDVYEIIQKNPLVPEEIMISSIIRGYEKDFPKFSEMNIVMAYGVDHPECKMPEEEKKAIKFAAKHKGWHEFRKKCKRTYNTIQSLAKKGFIEISEHTSQFRLSSSLVFYQREKDN